MCWPPLSEREYLDALHRVVAAIDIRCDRLERLLAKLMAVLEAREPEPPPRDPALH